MNAEHSTRRRPRVLDALGRARGRAMLRSARTRAALGLGVVLALGVTGTYAHWTDSGNLTGTTFSSGNLDLQLNNGDNAVQTTLSMTNMIPGATSAEVVTLRNNSGTTSLKWSLTGGLNGTDAATFATANAMDLTIRDGGSKVGTGQTSTCSGGTVLLAATKLTAVTSTSLVTGQGPLAAAGTRSLCFQFTFDAAAGNTTQSKSLGATFTFAGTSDLS